MPHRSCGGSIVTAFRRDLVMTSVQTISIKPIR
jgi:hypothetical protein